MKIKRDKLDATFSLLVRNRGWNRCCNCGSIRNIDCAHIMSRRHVATRWHPKNAIALCRSCHMFFGEHGFDFADFCRDKFGGDFVAELRSVAMTPVRWTPKVREEIYQHYKAELAKQELGQDFAAHELMHVFEHSGG